MRKAVGILVTIALIFSLATWLVWENKRSVAAYILSRHLGVPVDINNLDITRTKINLQNLWIGTPSDSRPSTSFSATKIEVFTDTPKIFDNPLIIDSIYISDIFVGLEYSSDGSTNWSKMLDDEKRRDPKGRNYLIQTLVLENLTVEVTDADGRKNKYPTIRRMEFQNISNETGFPIGEIEKAIFQLMLKDLMKKLNLFKPLNIPEQVIRGLFK